MKALLGKKLGMTQIFDQKTGEVTPVITAWHETLAGRGLTYEEWATFYQEMNHVIRAVADEMGVLLIDLDQAVPKTAEYIFDHVHLNGRGSELVADYLARKLADAYDHHACSAEDCE